MGSKPVIALLEDVKIASMYSRSVANKDPSTFCHKKSSRKQFHGGQPSGLQARRH